jgi:phage FluMu protein Com
MNLRCMYCNTMFGIRREDMLYALQNIDAENLAYFEFHCPKCRRANRVERKKLEMANPGWKEKVKEIAKEAAQADAPSTEEDKKPPAAKKAAAPKKAKEAAPKKKTASKTKAK